MYQATTMNETIIPKAATAATKGKTKKMFARILAMAPWLVLAAACLAGPKVALIGLAGACVLAAIAFYGLFTIALLRPMPKTNR